MRGPTDRGPGQPHAQSQAFERCSLDGPAAETEAEHWLRAVRVNADGQDVANQPVPQRERVSDRLGGTSSELIVRGAAD